jgi:ferredoxin-NADP reductase
VSPDRFILVHERTRLLTPRVRTLSFRREDGLPSRFVPGQSITLHLPWQGTELPRSFAIATIAGESDGLEVAVTEIGGRASEILSSLQPGARLAASGPSGRFVLEPDPPARYLLIATGTGVVPYRAMLPALKACLDGKQHSAVLLVGVRGPEDLLFGEDFLRFARQNPAFRFVAHYSRHVSEPALPHERKGYVQDHLHELEPNPAHDIVYLCGNPNMIDAATERLLALGFDRLRLRLATQRAS